MQSTMWQLSASAPHRGPRCSRLVASSAVQEATSVQRSVQFRPCIDIHKGKVKQIVGSTLQDLKSDGDQALKTNFESEHPSSWFAELYQRDALTGGHVIMLGADQASKDAAFGALRAYPGGLQLGGGVTTDNAAEYLDAGASHVIVTSFVFREGRLEEGRLADLVKLVGKQRLVLDLSCRKKDDGLYYVVTDRWQKFSDLALSEATLAYLAESCDEFLVHGVDVEGMQLGIDDQLVSLLGDWSPIPVTYAGGARTLEDLERVRVAGKGRVDITVGSALDIFGGQLPYADVVAWHNSQQQQQAAGPDAAPAAAPAAAAPGSSSTAAAAVAAGAPEKESEAAPAPVQLAPSPRKRSSSLSKAMGEVQGDGTILFADIPLGEPQADGTVLFRFD